MLGPILVEVVVLYTRVEGNSSTIERSLSRLIVVLVELLESSINPKRIGFAKGSMVTVNGFCTLTKLHALFQTNTLEFCEKDTSSGPTFEQAELTAIFNIPSSHNTRMRQLRRLNRVESPV